MTDWRIAQLSPHAPGFWLLLSLLATLALSATLKRTPLSWVQWLWLGHWLLIPYFGLLFGGLSPRLMGLAYFDWSVSLSLGAGLIFAVVALLVTVRMTVDLPSPHQSPTEESAPIIRSGAEHPLDAHRPAWQAVLMLIATAGAEQFHWSFLRNGLWEVLLTLPDPPELPAYWAIWIAALVVILTSAASPGCAAVAVAARHAYNDEHPVFLHAQLLAVLDSAQRHGPHSCALRACVFRTKLGRSPLQEEADHQHDDQQGHGHNT